MHKIIVHYNPINRYENQCMNNFSGLLKDTGEARFPWLSGGDGFLDLEAVLPPTGLQQKENVKTGQKGHLHRNPLFAAFTNARRERFTALPRLLRNLPLPLKLSSPLPSVPNHQPTRSFIHSFLFTSTTGHCSCDYLSKQRA